MPISFTTINIIKKEYLSKNVIMAIILTMWPLSAIILISNLPIYACTLIAQSWSHSDHTSLPHLTDFQTLMCNCVNHWFHWTRFTQWPLRRNMRKKTQVQLWQCTNDFWQGNDSQLYRTILLVSWGNGAVISWCGFFPIYHKVYTMYHISAIGLAAYPNHIRHKLHIIIMVITKTQRG